MERQFLVTSTESALDAFSKVFNPEFFKFVEVTSANIENETRFSLLTTPRAPVDESVEVDGEQNTEQPVEQLVDAE